MKKTYLRLFLCFMFAVSCSKDEKQQPLPVETLDAKGTWSFSFSTTKYNGNTTIISAADYPCTAKNIAVYEASGNGSFSYTGSDTCYIYRTPSTFQTLGTPGEPPSNFTWTQIGNTITMKFPDNATSTATLSLLNSKPVLTMGYTYTANNLTGTVTNTFSK